MLEYHRHKYLACGQLYTAECWFLGWDVYCTHLLLLVTHREPLINCIQKPLFQCIPPCLSGTWNCYYEQWTFQNLEKLVIWRHLSGTWRKSTYKSMFSATLQNKNVPALSLGGKNAMTPLFFCHFFNFFAIFFITGKLSLFCGLVGFQWY